MNDEMKKACENMELLAWPLLRIRCRRISTFHPCDSP
jgi:hypothetical protein